MFISYAGICILHVYLIDFGCLSGSYPNRHFKQCIRIDCKREEKYIEKQQVWYFKFGDLKGVSSPVLVMYKI